MDRIRNSLAVRVVVVLAITITACAWLAIRYAETSHLHTALDHARKQALVFLYGIERDVYRHLTLSPAALQEILDDALDHRLAEVDFTIVSLRLIDRTGNVVAAAPRYWTPLAANAGHRHGEKMVTEMVMSGRRPYAGGAVETARDPASGEEFPWTTLAIPIATDGGIAFALEADIDLQATMRTLAATDDHFRRNVGLAVGGSAVLALLVIWAFLHRRLLVPVRQLSLMAHQIAGGDLSPRATHLSGDELGHLAHDLNDMADSIERLMREEEQAYLDAMRSLLRALEAKDAYTAGHSAQVTAYSVRLGRRIGLSKRDLDLLEKGALLHDLGKIAIPDAILNKPGPLSDEEHAVMQRHPLYTASIVRPLKRFQEFAEIAAWHHERWDGTGYPDGLKEEQIPLLARIVAIADTWDAMTGDRIYRKGMPTAGALSRMEAERDHGQWDPRLVDAFIEMMREEEHPNPP